MRKVKKFMLSMIVMAVITCIVDVHYTYSETPSAGEAVEAASSPTLNPNWRIGDWWLTGESSIQMAAGRDEWSPPTIYYYQVVSEVDLNGTPCMTIEKWPYPVNNYFPKAHTVYYFRKSDKALLREVEYFYLQGDLQPPCQTDYPAKQGVPLYGPLAMPCFPISETKKITSLPLPEQPSILFDGKGSYVSQQVKTVTEKEVQGRLGTLDEIQPAIQKTPQPHLIEIIITEGTEENRKQCLSSSISQVWGNTAPWFFYEERKSDETVLAKKWLVLYGDANNCPGGTSSDPFDENNQSQLYLNNEEDQPPELNGLIPEEVATLQSDSPVSSLSSGQGKDHHFKINVPSGANTLEIRIEGGSGDCDLYVKHGSKVSTSDWDYRPYRGDNEETVTISNPQPGDWYIMLHEHSAYSGITLQANYIWEGSAITEEKEAPEPWAGWYWPLYDGYDPNLYDTSGNWQPLKRYDLVIYSGQDKARKWEYDKQRATSPGWDGHCHAWAAASILEKKPDSDSGFLNKGELEGLLVECYDNGNSSYWRPGNASNYDNTPMSPGDFWLALQENIGKSTPRPIIMDLYTGKKYVSPKDPIWNHPVYKYKLTAHQLSGSTYRCTAQIWYKIDTKIDPGDQGFLSQHRRSATYQFKVTVKNGIPVAGTGEWISSTLSNSSQKGYPDWAWFPNASPKPGNPHVNYTKLEFGV